MLFSHRQGNYPQQTVTGRILQGLLLVFCLYAPLAQAQMCPNLADLYPAEGVSADWPVVEQQLAPIMAQCLNSTEYFALLGAAQLNNGDLASALETLERALLLDPANGGAQVDYAQALFQQGQLFSALELNRQLLERQDLPPGLYPVLQDRQESWQGMTRQHGFQADMLLGYDTNLNGGPSPDQISLTLAGDAVVLPLSPDFQPRSGPYLNLRLASRYRQLAPQHQHNLVAELRGRVSEDTESDLLQLDIRYAFIRPGRQHSWQLTSGISHLLFGGEPLYTATELGARYLPSNRSNCAPFVAFATQHQLYHNQNTLNAVESKLGPGLSCPMENRLGRHQITAELNLLSNIPIKSGRPGGSRAGWQFNVNWQLELPAGTLIAQLNHTELDDRKSYSTLLANGADRWLERSYALLQYRQPWRRNMVFMVNLYHQEQRSNIELFRSRNSTIESGISITF